jgi:hemin uptake protein HemP
VDYPVLGFPRIEIWRRPPSPPPPDENVSVIASERLFAGRSEIRVRHRGQEYRLRITRRGKLILTK